MSLSQSIRIGLLATPFVFAMGADMPAFGDESRNVGQYLCKDVMRERGSERDVAIAFIHGFILGRSGSSQFVVEKLRDETAAFTERCLDNPNEPALDVLMKSKKM
jgi:hypothetical protein